MIDHPKTPGSMLDEIIQNGRRLAIAHTCLGLASAFVYWVRPGSITPHLPIYNFRDASPIYVTFFAWVPYVISFLFSRSILADRNHRAVFVFVICAAGIGLASAALLLRVFPIILSPIVVSGGVTIALVISAGLCSAVWRSELRR